MPSSFTPMSTGDSHMCSLLLEEAGSVHAAHKGVSPGQDKSVAQEDGMPRRTSAADSIASSSDSEGRLHLAIAAASLLHAAMASPVECGLSEVAWQAVWNLLATPGKHRSTHCCVERTA